MDLLLLLTVMLVIIIIIYDATKQRHCQSMEYYHYIQSVGSECTDHDV